MELDKDAMHLDETLPVTEEQRHAIEVTTATPRDPCAQRFDPPESEVLQMDGSTDPKTQTEKKEQLLKLTYQMECRAWKKVQTTSTPQKTKLQKTGKPKVTKRITQLESVKKTHKEAERQGLPMVIMDRDEKIDEEKEEPKDQDKQPAKKNKVGLSLKKEA